MFPRLNQHMKKYLDIMLLKNTGMRFKKLLCINRNFKDILLKIKKVKDSVYNFYKCS